MSARPALQNGYDPLALSEARRSRTTEELSVARGPRGSVCRDTGPGLAAGFRDFGRVLLARLDERDYVIRG